jgi:folate-binding protein YgfZ
MTELVETTAAPCTPLASYCLSAGSPAETPLELMEYLGQTTPQFLDAANGQIGAETQALLFAAAVHDLGWLRRIAVRGEDRYRWLSGMVTNTVEGLPDRTGAYNLVLNAQGRIQGDAYVWRSDEALELEMAANQAEALLAHLDRFIIMDDVELVPLEDCTALGLTGPLADAVLARLGLSALPEMLTSTEASLAGVPIRLCRTHGTLVPHYALHIPVSAVPEVWQALIGAGAVPAGTMALEALRVVEGIPAYGIDIQSRDLAQETSQMRAISFAKGCYLGQEIVERIRSRGQVHRHLRSIELIPDGTHATLPVAGSEIRLIRSETAPEAKPAGTLTSVAELPLGNSRRFFAIGMIRAEAEVGTPSLVYDGGHALVLPSTPTLTAD